MATSGVISEGTLPVVKLIETAYRRAGLKSEMITGEHLDIAMDALNTYLSALPNQKYMLCAVDTVIMPVYEGEPQITCPVGTIDITNYNYRTSTRLEGDTISSSAGGTIEYAVDGDFNSALTQTSPDGHVLFDFGAGSAPIVSNIGILPNADGPLDLAFEISPDNITWRTLMLTGSYTYQNNVWKWWDLSRIKGDRYFRVRETGGGTINVRELFLGENPSELPMYRFNKDDWSNLPNKFTTGRPLQFWLDRPAGSPVLNLWPVPDSGAAYATIVAKRYRYLMDVTALNEDPEIPRRVYEALCWQLSWRLCLEVPECDAQRAPVNKTTADEALNLALDNDTDNTPFRFIRSLSMYTR